MEEFDWNVYNEGQLLEAMIGHKPVGINKNFAMAFICDKFSEQIHKDICSDKIWQHLTTMYNLEALDEIESLPFPNGEKEFILPEAEFNALVLTKDEEKRNTQKGRETPKSMKDVKKEKDDKTPMRTNSKEGQRRDSKDSKDNNKTPAPSKKEAVSAPKKDGDRGKGKVKHSAATPRAENKATRTEDMPKTVKRPTRGSMNLKPDDSSSSGKSSPVTVTPPNAKRRRI